MDNTEPLFALGLAIIFASGLAILLPYLRGKSDILTAWNIAVLGGAMFMGVGSIAVTYGSFHWEELQWFQPTRSDVLKYIIGAVVFYAALFISYFYLKWPKRVADTFFNKWPRPTLQMLLVLLFLFATIAISAPFFRTVVFIGPLLFNVSHKALVFAVVFSFCFWYQNRAQFPLLLLFGGVFVFSLLDAMVLFQGRRLLLSVAVAPAICLYWLRWRYLPPRQNMIRVAFATFLVFSVAVVYGTFRHFSIRDGGSQRTFSTTFQALKGTTADSAISSVTSNPLYYFSQYCGHYSLLTVHLIDAGQIEVEPLNTLAFLATYPIPRVLFPAKPEPLGTRIVTDVLRLPYPTNWGLGIVGHGYHEGGIPVIILYGLLIVIGVRVLDDALVRQPNNPFLLAILSTAAPHLATLIRGDPSTMVAEIGEAYLFAWLIGFVARFVFGTAVVNADGAAPLAQGESVRYVVPVRRLSED
jgi:hypothetical protein